MARLVNLRVVNWVARGLGFAWIGVLALYLSPPHGRLGTPSPLAVAGYCLLGLGLAAWALVDLHPAAARHRARALPVILGVMAAATGFASAIGAGSTAMVAFTIVAALAAGSDTSLAAGLAVTTAGILGLEAGGLAYGDGYGFLLGWPALVVSGLVIGRNRGAYRIQAEQAAALLAQRERLQSEERRADLLDERARIAREIHDVLAHSLGALGIQIQAARAVLTDHADIAQADEILSSAQRMAAEGLEDTRRAVHALRDGARPLNEELAQVSDTYARRYQVAVRFRTGGIPRPLPPDVTLALLRIAQESLVNAAKHAAGEEVAVRLDYGDVNVRLTVRNDLAADDGTDGPAGVSTVNGGYGLTGMRERLRLLNGTLEAGRQGGQWVVTAEVPAAA